ncbi:hypothetical protein FSP39_013712 [Pinctada imbricata]|uniref:Uncharacterized protein n=1 Tax=Pinctada imbricata TaxID=66713 RepID=A0AA89C0T5_PINIB|nr:hypothetical protein FSP39_013712 [Pinctada imbricata]
MFDLLLSFIFASASGSEMLCRVGIQVLPTGPPDGPGSPKSPVEKKASITDDMRSSTEDLKERRHKKRKRREDKTSVSEKKSLSPTRGNWNLSKTALWEYPADLIITDLQELVNLDSFIYKKHHEYQKNCKNDTIFDIVFKKSLGDFHKEIQATIAIEAQKGEMSIPYQNLLAKFAHTLEAEVKSQGTNASFPVTMGVNAFRGFLDEFIKHHKKKEKEKKKPDNKNVKREHAKKKKDVFEYMKHKYTQVQFNIPTFCEYCTNIIWLIEKGSVCQVCKYTCHKKCVTKSTISCKGAQKSQNPGSRVFGAPLQSLVSESAKIPLIVERLIEKIELQGMYTVGVYRKSGAAAEVKELKQNIDNGSDDLSNPDILAYPIHVLTSLLKMFFRDLPEPLLTFECYDDFIRTSEIQDVKERVQSIYAVIEKLPKPNHDVFERLIYHLARVAYHESVNKMSPNGLAIIFAPALLRTNKKLQAQDSLNQVPRQTRVVEQIIEEQLGKLKEVLHDLSALETAEATAADRLSVVRNSIRAKVSMM